MSQCYNREGEPISHAEWSQKLGDYEYQVVKQDTLDNGLHVSTVWLGLNHNFAEGPPLIFETMASGNPICWRQHKTCVLNGVTIIPLLRIGDFPDQPTIAEMRRRFESEYKLFDDVLNQEYPVGPRVEPSG